MVTVDSLKLKYLLNNLIKFSEERSDNQGLVVYRNILLRMDECENEKQLVNIVGLLKKALAGMEAHGFFSNEELVVVDQIKNIDL